MAFPKGRMNVRDFYDGGDATNFIPGRESTPMNTRGRKCTENMNAEKCHTWTWYKFPTVYAFKGYMGAGLPRSISERIDLNANAKLVWLILSCWNKGVVLFMADIAGLAGLGITGASNAIKQLKNANLIIVRRRWRDPEHHIAAPNYYKTITPPSRFSEKGRPEVMRKFDAKRFEENMYATFHDIKFEREAGRNKAKNSGRPDSR